MRFGSPISEIAIEAGVRLPGYLSVSQDLKFSDVPAGCFASLEAVPTAGWLQIMVLTFFAEDADGKQFVTQSEELTKDSAQILDEFLETFLTKCRAPGHRLKMSFLKSATF